MVTPQKILALQQRMRELDMREEDLIEKFIQGSGAGGQKINKTSSCVYLKHQPTGVEVKCQRERSREINRFLARRELCDQIDRLKNGAHSPRQQEIALARQKAQQKIRRSQKRRTARINELYEKKKQQWFGKDEKT